MIKKKEELTAFAKGAAIAALTIGAAWFMSDYVKCHVPEFIRMHGPKYILMYLRGEDAYNAIYDLIGV